jgi:hypothetical protein
VRGRRPSPDGRARSVNNQMDCDQTAPSASRDFENRMAVHADFSAGADATDIIRSRKLASRGDRWFKSGFLQRRSVANPVGNPASGPSLLRDHLAVSPRSDRRRPDYRLRRYRLRRPRHRGSSRTTSFSGVPVWRRLQTPTVTRSRAEPKVRIQLPPAESQRRTGKGPKR